MPNSEEFHWDIVSRPSNDPRHFGGWLSRLGEFLNLLVSQEGSEPTSEALPQECDSAFQLSSYYGPGSLEPGVFDADVIFHYVPRDNWEVLYIAPAIRDHFVGPSSLSFKLHGECNTSCPFKSSVRITNYSE